MPSFFDPCVFLTIACGIITLQIVADTGQGWVNCILYIFLSPELRRRMFVLPYRRFMQRYRTQQSKSTLVTSEGAPLLRGTENSLSARAIAREEGNTYVSYHMDMSETVDLCSAQSELGSVN